MILVKKEQNIVVLARIWKWTWIWYPKPKTDLEFLPQPLQCLLLRNFFQSPTCH